MWWVPHTISIQALGSLQCNHERHHVAVCLQVYVLTATIEDIWDNTNNHDNATGNGHDSTITIVAVCRGPHAVGQPSGSTSGMSWNRTVFALRYGIVWDDSPGSVGAQDDVGSVLALNLRGPITRTEGS